MVYSRFTSKADMFLALLTDRIAERAAQNASAAGQLAASGPSALLELAWRAERDSPGWRLLVTQFRVHAARTQNSAAATRRPMPAPPPALIGHATKLAELARNQPRRLRARQCRGAS